MALQLAISEATTSWSGLLGDLQRRGLPAPLLVVTDGHAGLKKALVGPTIRDLNGQPVRVTESSLVLEHDAATRLPRVAAQRAF